MKIRILTLLLLVLSATSLFAEFGDRVPFRETIVVRDGKVMSVNGEPLHLGKRAFLGVALIDLTADLREHYGATKTTGALVGSVEENSPAAKAGIRVGDIVVSVDGKDVDSAADLRTSLRDKKDGETVRIDVLRGRNRQTLVATLVEKEASLPRFRIADMEGLPRDLGETLRSPEWRARIEALPNCADLQTRIRELEGRLRDLEKKLQK
jgi:membrane-associated protease RseP (regulator of RpoE activity)